MSVVLITGCSSGFGKLASLRNTGRSQSLLDFWG